MERHVAGALLLYLVWATLYAPNNPIHSRESLLSLWDGRDGLLATASLVGLVSNLCAFSALITAIIVRIAAF